MEILRYALYRFGTMLLTLLVVSVLAGAIWLGLRVWRRRQSSD